MKNDNIELLLTIPNILASLMCMFNLAFYANILFCIGFLPFIVINYKRRDNMHLFYFSVLWVMSICGVVLYLMGWSIEDLIR